MRNNLNSELEWFQKNLKQSYFEGFSASSSSSFQQADGNVQFDFSNLSGNNFNGMVASVGINGELDLESFRKVDSSIRPTKIRENITSTNNTVVFSKEISHQSSNKSFHGDEQRKKEQDIIPDSAFLGIDLQGNFHQGSSFNSLLMLLTIEIESVIPVTETTTSLQNKTTGGNELMGKQTESIVTYLYFPHRLQDHISNGSRNRSVCGLSCFVFVFYPRNSFCVGLVKLWRK